MTMLLFITLLCAVFTVQSQFLCQTPSGKQGVCRLRTECPELNEIAMKAAKTIDDYQFLWDSKCSDRSNLYCCPEPDCYTPDGVPGKYVNTMQCPEVLEMYNLQDLNFIYNSLSTEDNIVCCGQRSRPSIVKHDCANTVTAFPPDQKSECCGIHASGQNKIIGGDRVELDEFPWLAILNYNNIRILCGGSLISSRYVLTAAHCVSKNDPPISVTLGEYNKSSTSDCIGIDCAPPPQKINVQHYLNHPEYNPTDSTYKNDISLLRLATPALFTEFVRPICLPSYPDIIATMTYVKLTTAGWGSTTGNGIASDVKLQVELPLVPTEQCASTLNKELWSKQMCAGGVRNKDTCRGDSGGPLMYLTSAQYQIHGIVSFGSSECGNGLPAVYTKVFDYKRWILRNIKP